MVHIDMTIDLTQRKISNGCCWLSVSVLLMMSIKKDNNMRMIGIEIRHKKYVWALL